MRLAASPPGILDLDAIAGEVLDRRLAAGSARPVAVALSGGGDSVALLAVAARWARACGRPLLVLNVDHRLQPESAGWTEACAARAADLGAEFKSLAWTGGKPLRGLPAAARAARHARLADAAREAGARVILMGHTADDVREARAMRATGSTTPDPREWAPSPAWPEGRGVFLLRPLLAVARADIRAWLAARGERWIEDPANADLRYARARARQTPGALADPRDPVLPRDLAALCRMDGAGVLTIGRAALRSDPRNAPAFIGAACLCAAGATRPPAAARLHALSTCLLGETTFAATLAGARIEAGGAEVLFLREPGEAARGGLAPLAIAAYETDVWDGRLEIDGPVEVRPVAGRAATLSAADRRTLSAFPAKARAAMPMDADALVPARPLALARLHAACGLVEREPA